MDNGISSNKRQIKFKHTKLLKSLGYDLGGSDDLGIGDIISKLDKYIEPVSIAMNNAAYILGAKVLILLMAVTLYIYLNKPITESQIIYARIIVTFLVIIPFIQYGKVIKGLSDYNYSISQDLVKDIMDITVKEGFEQGIVEIVLMSGNVEIKNVIKGCLVAGKDNERYVIEDSSGEQYLVLSNEYDNISVGKRYSISYCKHTKLIIEATEIKEADKPKFS